MTKPILPLMDYITLETVAQYEHYLPSAFDDSMSMLQKINKTIKLMGIIGDLTNAMIDKWNEVYEWVMAEGLDSAVESKLIEWRDNGSLDAIINQTILGSKASIIVSATEPATSDVTTFWYKDLGDAGVNFPNGNSSSDGGIIVSSTQPSDTTKIWYDLE